MELTDGFEPPNPDYETGILPIKLSQRKFTRTLITSAVSHRKVEIIVMLDVVNKYHMLVLDTVIL